MCLFSGEASYERRKEGLKECKRLTKKGGGSLKKEGEKGMRNVVH